MRMLAGIVLLVLGQGLASCAGPDLRGPSAPSAVPQTAPAPTPSPQPVELIVFTDSTTGFSTVDVHDVGEQVVRFNSANELVWIADDTRFSGYRVLGDQIRGSGSDDWFQVRFGTKDGERRAYLVWSDSYCHCPGSPATLVRIEIVRGRLVFSATDVLLPDG